MVFKCQEDSFLKKFTSTVVTCTEVNPEEISDGNKNTPVKSYEVILEDTILFPEGGGQPCDHGFLNDIPVKKVLRREDKAIHYVNEPLEIGSTVEQTINWERRFDHMQQHSGQHLLSAVFEQYFNAPTVSWWLGEEDSFVELDICALSNDTIKQAEDMVNNFIRQGREVTVTIHPEDISEEMLEKVYGNPAIVSESIKSMLVNIGIESKVRSLKGLPEDHKGDIRVINIDGIDSNMCCGTHVKNLSQLQMLKLLHTEKSKRKNKILLHFLFGNRVLRRLETCIGREKKLTTLLNNNPTQHAELVEKLQQNIKLLNKSQQSILRDLAISDAQIFKNSSSHPRYFSLHRKDAEVGFITSFMREVGHTNSFLFLSVGDEKKEGSILLYGKQDAISALGPKVCELLDGKGAAKDNVFRAKVSNMSRRKDAEKLIVEYVNLN